MEPFQFMSLTGGQNNRVVFSKRIDFISAGPLPTVPSFSSQVVELEVNFTQNIGSHATV